MNEPEVGYFIDSEGFITGLEIVNDDNAKELILEHPPEGVLRKPKWTGFEWVEGKAAEDIEEEAFMESLLPSVDEIEKAEFELKILNILMEVELI